MGAPTGLALRRCLWRPRFVYDRRHGYSLTFWAIWAGSILTRAVDLTVLKSRVQEKDDEHEDRYNGYVGHGASMFGRRLMRCARFATHIELENTGKHDHGLRLIAVLKHGKPERLGAIDEESTAEATPVPNHPISPGVPADHKEWRSGNRGRLCVSHGGCP
jgi:hypothetical protein